MSANSLHELFVEELKDLYDAEHQITEALPKMRQAASSTQLKKAFEDHLAMTEKQIKRLEQVFEALDQKPSRKTCKGMQGLIKEGSEIISEKMDSDVRDAALITAAQKVEHYEIASYGSVRTFANLMGHDRAAKLLQQTLDEEGQTDEKLTQIAETLNQRANQ